MTYSFNVDPSLLVHCLYWIKDLKLFNVTNLCSKKIDNKKIEGTPLGKLNGCFNVHLV
jgi:hypothetical protein